MVCVKVQFSVVILGMPALMARMPASLKFLVASSSGPAQDDGKVAQLETATGAVQPVSSGVRPETSENPLVLPKIGPVKVPPVMRAVRPETLLSGPRRIALAVTLAPDAGEIRVMSPNRCPDPVPSMIFGMPALDALIHTWESTESLPIFTALPPGFSMRTLFMITRPALRTPSPPPRRCRLLISSAGAVAGFGSATTTLPPAKPLMVPFVSPLPSKSPGRTAKPEAVAPAFVPEMVNPIRSTMARP